jgi:hypothetical protein
MLLHTYSKTVAALILAVTLISLRIVLSPWRAIFVVLVYSSRVGHLVLEPQVALNWQAHNREIASKRTSCIYFKQKSDANTWLSRAWFRNRVFMFSNFLFGWDFDTAFALYQEENGRLLRNLPARVFVWDTENISSFF